MTWSIPITPLAEFEKSPRVHSTSHPDHTAIHSGKLGDIIYALPTLRELEADHLILNAYLSPEDPLRTMPVSLARQLAPLLLEQSYINKVSITQFNFPLDKIPGKIPGIRYNLDQYRNVARHRIDYEYPDLDPSIAQFSHEKRAVHLAQMFAASQGLRVDISQPWLKVRANELTKHSVIVSLTYNWRTYPNTYWKYLLHGLRDVIFVGTEKEWKQSQLDNTTFFPTQNHLELAEAIAGCRLFLGTISFPYAIAEALKVRRGVELCHHELNAFPTGAYGRPLPMDLLKARRWIASQLFPEERATYTAATRSLKRSPRFLSFLARLQCDVHLKGIVRQSTPAVRRLGSQLKQHVKIR